MPCAAHTTANNSSLSEPELSEPKDCYFRNVLFIAEDIYYSYYAIMIG